MVEMGPTTIVAPTALAVAAVALLLVERMQRRFLGARGDLQGTPWLFVNTTLRTIRCGAVRRSILPYFLPVALAGALGFWAAIAWTSSAGPAVHQGDPGRDPGSLSRGQVPAPPLESADILILLSWASCFILATPFAARSGALLAAMMRAEAYSKETLSVAFARALSDPKTPAADKATLNRGLVAVAILVGTTLLALLSLSYRGRGIFHDQAFGTWRMLARSLLDLAG